MAASTSRLKSSVNSLTPARVSDAGSLGCSLGWPRLSASLAPHATSSRTRTDEAASRQVLGRFSMRNEKPDSVVIVFLLSLDWYRFRHTTKWRCAQRPTGWGLRYHRSHK